MIDVIQQKDILIRKLQEDNQRLKEEVTRLEYVADGWEVCSECEGEAARLINGSGHSNDPDTEYATCSQCDGEGWTKCEDTFGQLIDKVEEWGRVVGITGTTGKGYPLAQHKVMVGEVEELRLELVKEGADRSFRAIKDELGDVFVTAIILADLVNVCPRDALEYAYRKINSRVGKGKMVNGSFVKGVV